MTGIFDSGVGGLTALYELRRLCPKEDIIYLADRENAPYGNKSHEKIKEITKANIEKLTLAGAERVLIACCTASTVYEDLPPCMRQVSVPIIDPAAKKAAHISDSGKIGVISTDATRRSGAFVSAIKKYSEKALVVSFGSPALVSLVEGGCRDENIKAEEKIIVERELSPFLSSGIDVLILGCTHFTHIARTAEEILGIRTVSASVEGAAVMAKSIAAVGDGRTIFYKEKKGF